MKIPFLQPKPTTGDGESTAISSSNPSHFEKDTIPTSQSPSLNPQSGERKEVETTPLEEAEAVDKLDDENEYPTGAKLTIITISLCLSVFLMALVLLFLVVRCCRSNSAQDNTIIATAIPKITDHFEALDDVGWYGSGR